MASDSSSGEKTRLCPTCRMEISVLATKCRYCGEPVGRPKEETRNLTIEELGGETVRHYAPSSNVMDALESFRADETMGVSPRGKPESFGLPELDATSRDLANVSVTVTARTASKVKRTPAWIRYTKLFVGILAAAAALYFGAAKGMEMYKEYQARKNVKPVYVNRAPELLASGASIIEVLGAAAEAVREDPTDENRKIAADVRASIQADVENLLNAKSWSMAELERASRLAHQAVEADPSPELRALNEKVKAERNAYSLVLQEIDPAAKQAVFRIFVNTPRGENVTIHEGETLADRFEVTSVLTTKVILKDTLRNGRRLGCVIGGEVQQ